MKCTPLVTSEGELVKNGPGRLRFRFGSHLLPTALWNVDVLFSF